MGRLRAIGRRLLRVPLFHKILLANSVIAGLGAVAGVIVVAWHIGRFPDIVDIDLILLVTPIVVLVSCAVNYVVLRLALAPLDQIEATLTAIQQGQTGARFTAGPLSDERFDRLVTIGNQMLSALEQDAQQLHHLSQEILQAQEEERRRVARELHDEAAQSLTLLLMRLRLLETAQDPNEMHLRIQEVRNLTAQTLEEVRRIALELRPKILDDLGLVAALSWQVDEFNAAQMAHANLRATGVAGRLPGDVELVFYRVAREALANVARHAQAHQVDVTLQRGDDSLTLEIHDDGIGFDLAALQSPLRSGMGLSGMRERLALVGGEIVIESQPGAGTRVFARAPLARSSRESVT